MEKTARVNNKAVKNRFICQLRQGPFSQALDCADDGLACGYTHLRTIY
jgi:hypothetical protein